MPKNRQNITTGGGSTASSGYAFAGAENAIVTPPTSTSGAITGMTALGHVSTDGVVLGISGSADPVRDWSNVVVKYVQTEGTTDTLAVTLMQIRDAQTLALIYGGANVTVNPDGSAVAKGTGILPPPRALCFDVFDPDSGYIRIFAPAAKLTEIGDRSFTPGEVVTVELTYSLLWDESIQATHLFLTNDLPDPEEG